MGTRKFTSFGEILKKIPADMTAVTKLFQMKLKTTKHYLSHLTEKMERIFWPTR